MSLVKGIASKMDASEQTTLTLCVDDLPAAGVDLAGCAGAAFYVVIGAGGSQGTCALNFYEGSTTTPTADIDADDLEFNSATFGGASPETGVTHTDAGVHFIGYHGSERYIRIEIDSTATTPDWAIATGVIRWPLRRAGGTP
jgi:hypothetical protein